MSGPICSLLGLLWLQFHGLTRRSQTHYISPLCEYWLQLLWLPDWSLQAIGSPYWSLNTALLAFPSVSGWLALVLLWISQVLFQVSTSVSHKGLYQIHLIKQSYYEALSSKLNRCRGLNTELYWQSYITVLLSTPAGSTHTGDTYLGQLINKLQWSTGSARRIKLSFFALYRWMNILLKGFDIREKETLVKVYL